MYKAYQKLRENKELDVILLSENEYPIPKPFCYNKKGIKAIILGADPSNFSNKGETVKLTTVFGIGSGDARYFEAPLINLHAIGLGLEDVYIDNLVKNYCCKVTDENEHWQIIAKEWVNELKEELDELDKKKSVPVLLTAGKLYKVLVTGQASKVKPIDFYSCRISIPVNPKENLLERPIIPFYRNKRKRNYLLDNPEWGKYVSAIKKVISSLNTKSKSA